MLSNRYKIDHTNSYLISILICCPLLFPDSYRNIVNDLISKYGMNKYTPVLVLLFLILAICKALNKNLKNKSILWNKKFNGLLILFLLEIIIILIKSKNLNYSLIRILEIVLPIGLASLISSFLPPNRNEIKKTIYNIVYLLLIYSVVFLVWWFIKLRFDHQIDPNLGFVRFRTPYTGAVTYAMLISIVFPFIINIRKINKTILITYILMMMIYGAVIFLSGTRTALIISLIIILFRLLFQKGTKTIGSISFIVAGLLLLAFILPNILNGYHRFISLESSRFSTQSNVLEIIKNDPDKIIIGYGLSNFFPYNKWYAGQKSNRKNENIYYDDDVNAKILVEPHSLYIWLLAETGLVGLFLFGGYYYTNFMKKAIIIIKTPDNYEPIIVAWALAIVSISIASFSGSFIINEPQIALVCWFISISFSKYIAISQNRSLTNKYLLSVKNISIKK